MPKKQRNNFLKQLEGTSSGKAPGSNGSSSTSSVNQKLSELRKLEGRDAAKKKAELVQSSSNLKSVHPSLRGILGIVDTAPPKPKRAARARLPNRTPGPAPPASWTKTPGWTPLLALRTGQRRFRKRGTADIDRNRPPTLQRFARMAGIGDASAINERPRSLMHTALKTAAEQWHLFDEEDLPMLTELPLRLRLALLSYLGYYGPAIGVDVLDALTTGSEALLHLDLAGLAGHGNLSISRVAKLAKQLPVQAEVISPSEDDVVDSWDQDDSFEAALAVRMPSARFANLTHLSLGYPPLGISWRDLLSLSKQTPKVTHLSLAHWQRPTLTPNLTTATVSSQHSPDVNAGGSHFYSALDQDMYEPAAIIRQLSNNLLSLKWLDLEGCTDWSQALSFKWTAETPSSRNRDAWLQQAATSSVWVSTWKNVAYVNLTQSWLPKVATLRLLPRQQMSSASRAIIDKLAKQTSLAQLACDDDGESLSLVAQRKAQIWLELEERAVQVGKDINRVRREQHARLMDVDHGWIVE